jgi:hypothetical protein
MSRQGASRGREAQSVGAEPTLKPEEAVQVYDELVELAKKEDHQSVHNRLGGLGLADLNLQRRELGASLGKKKPSRRVLEEAIIGRTRESVLLSKHSRREHASSEANTPPDPSPDGEDSDSNGTE